jgi:hypothetical protein
MDFMQFLVVFAVFFLGLVLAIQGFVRKEPHALDVPHNPRDLYGAPLGRFDDPGIVHPPEQHPVRLMLIGAGLMILAVVLGFIVL